MSPHTRRSGVSGREKEPKIVDTLVKKIIQATPKEQLVLLFWRRGTPHEENTHLILPHLLQRVCGTVFEASFYWWRIVDHWGLAWLRALVYFAPVIVIWVCGASSFPVSSLLVLAGAGGGKKRKKKKKKNIHQLSSVLISAFAGIKSRSTTTKGSNDRKQDHIPAAAGHRLNRNRQMNTPPNNNPWNENTPNGSFQDDNPPNDDLLNEYHTPTVAGLPIIHTSPEQTPDPMPTLRHPQNEHPPDHGIIPRPRELIRTKPHATPIQKNWTRAHTDPSIDTSGTIRVPHPLEQIIRLTPPAEPPAPARPQYEKPGTSPYRPRRRNKTRYHTPAGADHATETAQVPNEQPTEPSTMKTRTRTSPPEQPTTS
ncbi:hypothetical protein BS47DRAFT_1364654 [Hydnum rufescens UP504]|uniref:Uncharacterized protein n=1 Tax=Hydnum rufescens UP504 TaxID=1448309 RepID=A0A9P6ARA8_9AGAM|nr:hypothetical protein BS47DRAFT_1364654 [Hydnum rufescens UP504]